MTIFLYQFTATSSSVKPKKEIWKWEKDLEKRQKNYKSNVNIKFESAQDQNSQK